MVVPVLSSPPGARVYWGLEGAGEPSGFAGTTPCELVLPRLEVAVVMLVLPGHRTWMSPVLPEGFERTAWNPAGSPLWAILTPGEGTDSGPTHDTIDVAPLVMDREGTPVMFTGRYPAGSSFYTRRRR
jgi:hypothetical protein